MHWIRLVCLALVVASAGCGARSRAFSDNAKPIAEEMAKALQARDMTRIDRSLGIMEERFKRHNVRDTDFETIKSVHEQAKAGKWDEAIAQLEACLKRSQ